MANEGDRIDVKVGATTGELKSGMDQSVSHVKAGVAGMQGPFDQMRAATTAGMQQMQATVTNSVSAISASLGGLGKIAATVGAILGGGYFFKSAIEAFADFVSGADRVRKAMGGDINEAAALTYAFKRVGISVEEVEGLMRSVVRTIRATEGEYNNLGVRVRDVNGNFVDARQYLFENLEKLKEYKKGLDRGTAAAEAFGMRGVANIGKFLKVTLTDVENAKKYLESLGMTIGPDFTKQILAFKTGLVDAQTVMTALQFQVGKELLPALQGLIKFFSDQGPAAVRVTIGFFRDLQAAGVTLRADWDISKKSAVAAWDYIVAVIRGGTEAVVALMSGNSELAASLWEGGLLKAQLATKRAMRDIQGIVADANAQIEKIKSPGTDKPPAFAPEGASYGGGGGKGGGGKSRLQEWQQELEEMRVAEDAFLDFSRAREKEFWEEKLRLCKEGSDEYRQIRHRIFTINKEIAKEEVQLEIAAIREKMASEKAHGKTVLQQQDEIMKILAAKYGQDSMEYRREQLNKTRILEQEEKKRLQAEVRTLQLKSQLAQIDIEMARETAQFEQQMGRMGDAQTIARLRQLKAQEYAIKLKELEDEKKLNQQKERDTKEVEDRISILKKQHVLEMLKFDQQYTLAVKRQWDQMFTSLAGAATNAVQSIAHGFMTLGQAVMSIFQTILDAFINIVSQMLTQWIAAKLMEIIYGHTAAVGTIKADSGRAFTAAYASICAIPVVGPFMAPEIAAAAAAAALAGGLALTSAEGGFWRVPKETVSILHPDEQVLPAWAAQGLRRLVGGEGGGHAAPAGANLRQTVNIRVVTPDGRTLLKANRTLLYDLVNEGQKHGEIVISPAQR